MVAGVIELLTGSSGGLVSSVHGSPAGLSESNSSIICILHSI